MPRVDQPLRLEVPARFELQRRVAASMRFVWTATADSRKEKPSRRQRALTGLSPVALARAGAKTREHNSSRRRDDTASGTTFLQPGSGARAIYGREEIVESYNCSYGVNAAYQSRLDDGSLRISGVDAADAARIVELALHSFFIRRFSNRKYRRLNFARIRSFFASSKRRWRVNERTVAKRVWCRT